VSYTSKVTLEPSDIVVGVELSNNVTEITVFLDADEMVDLAVSASHRCDGSRHD